MNRLLIFLCATLLSSPCLAATINIPADYGTIQAGINAANQGDVVLVWPGTYYEDLKITTGITLQSLSGHETTTIDASQAGYAVTFQTLAPCALSGFTVTNAKYVGVYCNTSSPRIENNIITKNNNGGIAGIIASAQVIQNEISFNGGSGISFSEASDFEIIGNRIHHNSSPTRGGGVYYYYKLHTRIINNLIYNNSAADAGGGICCGPFADSMLANNTIVFNTAAEGGGIALQGSPKDSIANNCILWGNSAPLGPQISMTNPSPVFDISYSNVQGGLAAAHVEPGCTLNWGPGMLDQDPDFAGPGDFHLNMNSPCINMGTLHQAPADDIDSHPRPYMGTVDMGADEYVFIHTLSADRFDLSAAAGGVVTFYPYGGPNNLGRNYLIFCSITGTWPGTPLPGGLTLPIQWDGFTNLALQLVNTPNFLGFAGTLNNAWARFDTLGALPSSMAGAVFSFAFIPGSPFDFVSNPINIKIKP